MATNALRYADQILDNVRQVLWHIKEHGGMAPTSFLNAEVGHYQGQYATVVMNVALGTIDKKPAFQSDLSQSQLESLVARAKQQNGDLVAEIAQLRAAKGK